MIINFDHFNKCENPILTICNPNNKTLSVIANYTDLELEPNFSAISTVKLTVYKYIKDKVSDSEDNKKREADCWKYIAECRQIHVENIGYFPIISVTTNDNKDNPSCEIEADSCESEWNNHGIALSAGVYQFYDATKPNDTILGKILNLCPTWNIGYISTTVANTFRTFDDLEKSVYQFLMEDCTNAYECFIVPDIQNRTISVYSSHDEIPNTDILLTYDNVLKNCKIERLAENIYTALKVTGGADDSSSDNSELSIISANPLGTDTIYNFSYYMNTDWMTQGLIDAINAWNKKIADSQTNYNTIITNISNAESEYATIDGQLSDATAQLNAYKDEMNALQSTDQSGYAQAKTKFDAQQVVVNNIKSQLDAKQTTINGYETQLTTLQNSLSLESNFTHEQILELTPYIKQTTYKDENITVTDNMTWAERYAQIQTLYTRGVNKLAELSQPTYTITIECVNFAFIKEFEHFRSQFNLGNMIHVENDPQGDILNFIILSYDIKYNSYDLEIKLSNKLKPHDAYSKTKDLYSNLSNSASTLSVNKNSWSYPVKSGTISDLKDFMDRPLDLSIHELITKNDQSPLVDKYGIHGRKINADGSVDLEQLDIRNNEIAFSTDGGNTIKSAFGKMQLPNGVWVYGLNADAVVAGTIDASVINVININASNIKTGMLSADLIDTTNLKAQRIYNSDLGYYASIGSATLIGYDASSITGSGITMYDADGTTGVMASAKYSTHGDGNFDSLIMRCKSGSAVLSLSDHYSDNFVTNDGSAFQVATYNSSDHNYFSRFEMFTGSGTTNPYGGLFAFGHNGSIGIDFDTEDTGHILINAGNITLNGLVDGVTRGTNDVTIDGVTLHFKKGWYTGYN